MSVLFSSSHQATYGLTCIPFLMDWMNDSQILRGPEAVRDPQACRTTPLSVRGGGGKIRTAPHGPMMWAPWVDVWFLLKTAREQPVRARECDVTEALPTHQTILLRRLTYPTKVSTECPKQEISFPVSINLGLCCSVSAMSSSMLKGTVPTTMSPRSMRLRWAGAGLPSS